MARERERNDLSAEMLRHADWLRAQLSRLPLSPEQLDDALQTTFVATLASPPQHLRNIRGWLLRVALNQLGMSRRRRRCRERNQHLVITRTLAPSAFETAEHGDLCAHVQRAVRDMPSPYREVIWLHYLCGYPSGTVATILRRPPNTVRSQLRRGGCHLRGALQELAPN